MLKSVSEFVSKVAGRIEQISMEQALKIENILVVDVREPPRSLNDPLTVPLISRAEC